MQEINNPYPIFLGLDGLALELGYIRIGNENTDPDVLANQKAIWFDEAGTQAAEQPVRTLAGYPDRDGSPAQLFVSGRYSIRVRNAQGEQVFYLASAGGLDSGASGQPYHIHTQFLGDAPSAQQIVCKHVFAAAVSFEADLPDAAYFHVGGTPGDDAEFAMRHDGVQYGTLTIDTNGDLQVECDAQDFDVGDRFELTAPDGGTSLTDLAGTIVGETE